MEYYVYIIKCEKWKYSYVFKEFAFDKVLYYTGITTDLKKRIAEHRTGVRSNWMAKNNISPKHFVYVECLSNYYNAINREKQIKKMSLKSKLKLIKEYLEPQSI